MKQLTEENFEARVNGANKPVLVDFSAAWCGPCRIQEPLLERFAEAHPEVEVFKVDVDASPAIASKHGVTAMPTLIVFEGGEQKAHVRGLQSLAKLEALVAGAG